MANLENVKDLFVRALALPESEDRLGWLKLQCRGDNALLQEVSSLLHAYAGAQVESVGGKVQLPEVPEASFGPYRAVELLGRGGTSAVYRAERVDGKYQQTVALKVMAAFLNGPEFLRRFATERQLLASLNHPRIAHLLDGGTSASGTLYLAMEYVDGERLDRYCDRNKCNITERLRLFLQVCDAVDYVHRRLIVHRDLKPNNLLVTSEGEVKLLDFGTGALLATQSDITVTRTRMMTPRYASPERLRGEPASVGDDVFSLGVILYELLTGAWPFGDPDSALQELRRVVEAPVPALPATAATAEAAESRGVRLRGLQKQLAGDLSAIVTKALEHDSSQRYATVRELSTDVERYLSALPVAARRPTAYYRAGKFLRRHWVAATLAVLVAAGLGTATAVAVVQARNARASAIKADSVNEFLSGMLSTFGPSDFDAEKYTVVQMLDAAQKELDTGPKRPPLVEAVLRRSLAESYLGLARLADARKQLDRAIPVLTRLGDQKELVSALCVLANVEQDEGKIDGAVRTLEDAQKLLDQLGKSAPAIAVFEVKLRTAEALSPKGGAGRDNARRQRLLQEALALGDRDSTIPRTRYANAVGDAAALLLEQGRLPEAQKTLLKALEIGRRERAGGSWEMALLYQLEALLERQGDLAGAREYARQEAELMSRTAGPNHPTAAVARVGWARLAARSGEVNAAVKAVDEAMPLIEKGVPAASPSLWIATRDASVVMRLGGRLADSERYARESLEAAQAENLAQSDPRLANSWQQLGNALAAESKTAQAIRCLEQARGIYAKDGAAWAGSEQAVAKRIAELQAAPRAQ